MPGASVLPMSLRRILVLLLLLMIVMSITAGLQPPRRLGHRTAAGRPAYAGQVQTVSASLPKDRVVHAAVGDRIALEVVADDVDQVEIEGYDLIEPVDPGTPAQFDFVADQAGRFRVTVGSAGKTVGRLEVVERP